MLRGFVIGIGVLCLGGAVLGLLLGAGPAIIGPVILGGLLLAGTVFEKRFYRKLDEAPPGGAAWELTGERFRDTDGPGDVEVWYNKETGDRRYVKVGG